MTGGTPKARFAFVQYRRVFAAVGWTAAEGAGERHGASTDAAPVKRAILTLLDAVADEHPLGHQPSKAARYVLLSRHGARVEIMFEKNVDSPPNFWCRESAAGAALIAAQRSKLSPSSALWAKRGVDGERLYGRHSALRPMPQLGGADLVRFLPTCVAEAERIIDRLRTVTPADLS